MPVDDNGRSLFLGRGEDAIVVRIEQAHDLMESLSPMVIPKYFRMDEWVTIAKIFGKLHFGVLCVIPANKSSHKPDNDNVPVGVASHHRRPFPKECFLAMRECHKNHSGQDKNKREDFPMPTLHGDFSRFVIQRATRSGDAP
jgi:hypothetical protein